MPLDSVIVLIRLSNLNSFLINDNACFRYCGWCSAWYSALHHSSFGCGVIYQEIAIAFTGYLMVSSRNVSHKS